MNATFATLLASCRMVGVEPWEYLRDLFCLLPAWPAHRVLELVPAYWAGTREREDVGALLAADPAAPPLSERWADVGLKRGHQGRD